MPSNSTTTITLADVTQATTNLPGLVALLQNAVDQGASVGFLAPLAAETAALYWHGVLESVASGDKKLWLAHAQGTLVGAVQLEPCGRENGRHRAEVQKLFVLHTARRAGVAALLMQALEQYAGSAHIRTLFLDTETGSPAELFYQRGGYTKVGDIPDYCLSSGGAPSGTSIYYKPLTRPALKEAA